MYTPLSNLLGLTPTKDNGKLLAKWSLLNSTLLAQSLSFFLVKKAYVLQMAQD